MKKNDIVAVTFLDHVESGPGVGPLKFTVYGRVASVDARAVVVCAWAYADTRRRLDHNTTAFTILRSCILRATTLVKSETK